MRWLWMIGAPVWFSCTGLSEEDRRAFRRLMEESQRRFDEMRPENAPERIREDLRAIQDNLDAASRLRVRRGVQQSRLRDAFQTARRSLQAIPADASAPALIETVRGVCIECHERFKDE